MKKSLCHLRNLTKMTQLDVETCVDMNGCLWWNNVSLGKNYDKMHFVDCNLKNIWDYHTAEKIVQAMNSHNGSIQQQGFALSAALLSNETTRADCHVLLSAVGITPVFIGGLDNENDSIKYNSLCGLCNIVTFNNGDISYIIKHQIWQDIIKCIKYFIQLPNYSNHWEEIETGCLVLSNICADYSQVEGIDKIESAVWTMQQAVINLLSKINRRVSTYVASDLFVDDPIVETPDETEMLSLFDIMSWCNCNAVWNLQSKNNPAYQQVLFNAFVNICWLNRYPSMPVIQALRRLVHYRLGDLPTTLIGQIIEDLGFSIQDDKDVYELCMKTEFLIAIAEFLNLRIVMIIQLLNKYLVHVL